MTINTVYSITDLTRYKTDKACTQLIIRFIFSHIFIQNLRNEILKFKKYMKFGAN